MATTTLSYTTDSTSRHSCVDDDPKFIIHRMVATDEFIETPAEHALVAWLMSLPDEQDPASSAQRLLDHYETEIPNPSSGALRTMNFLRQTAQYPLSRLSMCGRPSRKRRRYNA